MRREAGKLSAILLLRKMMMRVSRLNGEVLIKKAIMWNEENHFK